MSPPSTPTTAARTYKGKVTHRSWPQLPEELVRHIATFYLWDLTATAYCPQSWDKREYWYHRLVFTTLRDADSFEKHMMDICPQWHIALQQHLFWQKAVAVIDPNDILAHHAIVLPKPMHHTHSSAPSPQPHRLTSFHHFRNMANATCIVCRMNSPASNNGLLTAKTLVYTPYMHRTPLCRDHGRRLASFCGICLRDAPPYDSAVGTDSVSHFHAVSVVENEDQETFPNVDATCRSCRMEWLWRRVSSSPRDREALGGRELSSPDWETRSTVESFIDLAEGTIKDVVELARAKHWMRMNTRLADMLEQALAASRYNRSRSYDAVEDDEEDEDEDEDEEMEAMNLEENGVRELALCDWARIRIMDGHWFSPADFWYGHALPGKPMHVRAMHPCPWSREVSSPSSSLSPVEDESVEEEQHPCEATVRGEIPPTFSLCEQAFHAHQRQLRLVIIPAVRNLVRKIVIECAIGTGPSGKVEDPAIRAARMTMEDVLAALREEEGVWFEGFDWEERGMNARREMERSGDDSSCSSRGSGSSGETSPVLSTSTLQTTPSPEPIVDGIEGKGEEDGRLEIHASLEREAPPPPIRPSLRIPVAPVLDPPRLLPSIPYVPVTASHFPHFTMEAFKQVWREACAPLFHCRCRICLRASAKANGVNGQPQPHAVVQQQPEEKQSPPIIVIPAQVQKQHPPVQTSVQVKLQEAAESGVSEEEEEEVVEVEVEADEYVVLGSDLELEVEEDIDDDDEGWYTATSTPQAQPTAPVMRARKRSSDEVDREEMGRRTEIDSGGRVGKGETPPKRLRREEPPHFHPGKGKTGAGLLVPLPVAVPSLAQSQERERERERQPGLTLPRRMRKRSSEEVQDASADEGLGTKRVKMSPDPVSVAERRSPTRSIGLEGEGCLTESPPSTDTSISRSSSACLSSTSSGS